MRVRARDLNLAGRGKGAYKLQLEERTGSTGAEVSFDNVTLRGVIRPCLLRSCSGASKAPGDTSHLRAFTRDSLSELSPEPEP